MTRSVPRGHLKSPDRRGAEATREALMAAAKKSFANHAYDQVGMRDIAALAGVDKRLITRYFGSKERLFVEAMRSSLVKFQVPVDGKFGRLFAERTFGASDLTHSDRVDFINLCIHSAAAPIGKRLVRANVREQIAAISGNIGGEDARLRAAMFLLVSFGTALLREVLKIEELTELPVDKALKYFEPLIQSLLTVDQRPASAARSARARRDAP